MNTQGCKALLRASSFLFVWLTAAPRFLFAVTIPETIEVNNWVPHRPELFAFSEILENYDRIPSITISELMITFLKAKGTFPAPITPGLLMGAVERHVRKEHRPSNPSKEYSAYKECLKFLEDNLKDEDSKPTAETSRQSWSVYYPAFQAFKDICKKYTLVARYCPTRKSLFAHFHTFLCTTYNKKIKIENLRSTLCKFEPRGDHYTTHSHYLKCTTFLEEQLKAMGKKLDTQSSADVLGTSSEEHALTFEHEDINLNQVEASSSAATDPFSSELFMAYTHQQDSFDTPSMLISPPLLPLSSAPPLINPAPISYLPFVSWQEFYPAFKAYLDICNEKNLKRNTPPQKKLFSGLQDIYKATYGKNIESHTLSVALSYFKKDAPFSPISPAYYAHKNYLLESLTTSSHTNDKGNETHWEDQFFADTVDITANNIPSLNERSASHASPTFSSLT